MALHYPHIWGRRARGFSMTSTRTLDIVAFLSPEANTVAWCCRKYAGCAAPRLVHFNFLWLFDLS